MEENQQVITPTSKHVTWAKNNATVFELKCLWTIQEFNEKIVPSGSYLNSGTFSSPWHDINFELMMKPPSTYNRNIGLHMICEPGNSISSKRVNVKFTIALVNADDEIFNQIGVYFCRLTSLI